MYNIQKFTLEHRSGSKEYHLLLVQNLTTQNALLVNRWGKAGAWGQMKTEIGHKADMAKSAKKKIDEKENRGYSISSSKSESFANFEDAKNFIGIQYWAQMGANNIKHVFPDADVSGVREVKPAIWKEVGDGKYVRDDKPEHSMPSPEEELAEKKSNPNWGLF